MIPQQPGEGSDHQGRKKQTDYHKDERRKPDGRRCLVSGVSSIARRPSSLVKGKAQQNQQPQRRQ